MLERIEKLEAFLRETPDDRFLNHALALEYIKLGKDQEAGVLLAKNLGSEPAYVASYYHFGKLLERTGEPQKALAVYAAGMEAARAAGDMHTYNELQAAHEDLE